MDTANKIYGCTTQFIQRPPAGLTSRSQRFEVNSIAPKKRLPGWLAQPEGKFESYFNRFGGYSQWFGGMDQALLMADIAC